MLPRDYAGENKMPIVSGALGLIGIAGAGAAVAGPLLDKAAEQLFDNYGKKILEDIQARLRAYTGKVPLNHDLEHVIRLAELTSTLVLLETYRRQDENDHFDERTYQPPLFIEAARKWLHDQLGLSWRMKLIPNDTLVQELERQLDQSLSTRKREELRASLKEAERHVWCDLIAGAQSGEPPPEFAEIFFGNDIDQPGWSVTFLAFMREVLKKNPRAEVAFVTTRLSGALEALRRVETNLALVVNHTAVLPALQEDVSELLAMIRQNQLNRQARQEGLPDALVKPKYFDTKTREIIRSTFSIYRQDYEIDLPILAARIEDHLSHQSEVSAKILRRFMKGIRVDDSFVALLTGFADTLTAPPVPVASPIYDDTRFELAINERAEMIVFYNKLPLYPLSWLEFHADSSRLHLVIGGGFHRDIPIRPELARYMRRAHRSLMVYMDEKTGEPIEGDYLPLLVFKADPPKDPTN